MRYATTTSNIDAVPPPSGKWVPALTITGRRLLAAAAVLHLMLAVTLHWAGRAQVMPGLIDRDGIMSSFAFDSYEYREGATRLAGVLKEEGLSAWAAEPVPVHVKLISLQFTLLGPLFGYTPLSAEPLNLLCYIAIIALVLALSQEVGGGRGGLVAAAAVALWPTFLLHTTQLLKDPLFISAMLAILFVVMTLLTRDYGWRGAVAISALMGAALGLLMHVRVKFAPVIFALALSALALLFIRQVHERRARYWYMACLLVMLILTAALVPLKPASVIRKYKEYPSEHGGQPKIDADSEWQLPAIISYVGSDAGLKAEAQSPVGPLFAEADSAARALEWERRKFTDGYPEAGSNIDSGIEFRNIKDVILYLPRAFAIGMWAPFPNTWVGTDGRVGRAGRLLSGAETLVFYLCQPLALFGALRPPRRLAAWLLLIIILFGVIGLGLVVTNVGAIYRFRYILWMLLLCLGVKGLVAAWTTLRACSPEQI